MITTERLSLRKIQTDDEDFIIKFLADEELAKYLPLDRPYNANEASTWFDGRLDHWRLNGFGTFIIVLKHSNDVMGYCGIEYVRGTKFIDMRYGLLKCFWGHGYAYEAALAVLQYGFSVHAFSKLYGAAVPQNIPSIKLLQKLGMSKDSEFNVYGQDVSHYSISLDSYNNNIAEQKV